MANKRKYIRKIMAALWLGPMDGGFSLCPIGINLGVPLGDGRLAVYLPDDVYGVFIDEITGKKRKCQQYIFDHICNDDEFCDITKE